LSQDPPTVQKAYGIADFAIGINDNHGHYKVTASSTTHSTSNMRPALETPRQASAAYPVVWARRGHYLATRSDTSALASM
jgi:hypothetical protein